MSSRYYASKNQPWIPDQWFVAKHAYRGGDVPLAYMVPEGDDSQAKKRKSNARDWAKPGRGRYYNANTGQWEDVDDSEEPEFMTIEPASQTGFRIASVAKRSGRESNRELFRVVDPRGFELEIDPGNFLKIMRNANVDKGTIHTELAWVRAGSNNLLIPTKSDDYEEAVEESKARNSNLGMGDVELGWTVRIQRGMKGQYLGRWDIIKGRKKRKTGRRSFTSSVTRDVEVNTNRRHLFFDRENDVLIVHGSPKPGTITRKENMTYGEAAQIANDNIDKINVAGNTNYHRIIGFTRDRGDSLEVENNIAKWNTGEHARQESHGIG